MGIVQNVVRRPRSKPRVFKTGDGKVVSENIRGGSIGRGGIVDQRKPVISSRPLKNTGRKVRVLDQ
jgi:hypothetical protein